jgi:hypothetical protein
MRRIAMGLTAVAVPAWLAACAGYNLQLGTGSDASSAGGFYEVYEKPATSAETPAERSSSGRAAAPPPPDNAAADADSKSKERAGSTK